MVRPRKTVSIKHVNPNGTSSSSASSDVSDSRGFKMISFWKTTIGCVCFVIAVYVGTLGYLETRVNTPFDDDKIVTSINSGLAVPERYWGSYRPGVYFGMKTREPRSPVLGLMWYEPTASHKGIRHWCEQGDNLETYGWLRHDGVNFGEQIIVDNPHILKTSFIKTPGGDQGGHWSARIEVETKGNVSSPFTLMWYTALDESLGSSVDSKIWLERGAVKGYSPQLGHHTVSFKTNGKLLHSSSTEAHAPGLHLLKEKVYSLLRAEKHPKLGRHAVLGHDMELDSEDKQINFIVTQLLVETPFTLEVLYTTEDFPVSPLNGDSYTQSLQGWRVKFDEQFEKVFRLKEKGYNENDVSIARAAFSNMIGGIGYFYGAGRVKSQYTKEPVPYWRAPLYTAVPSRSFFPRGFLWDEGFHGLLIGKWSPEIELDIAAHWVDLINVEGWIPREQILGSEALARVPKEFVVQSNAAANPPMLLVVLSRLIEKRPDLFAKGKGRAVLESMFSRLQAWYNWFQTTQKGEDSTSYRWRGRVDDGVQLNPKTLTSGLDDYPRSSHPSDLDRHVDLRCWMYAAADAMTRVARVLRRDSEKFEVTRDQLGDENLLNELHWSKKTETYADYGLHTDGVRLVRQSPKTLKPNEQPKVVRSVTSAPQLKLVTSAFGYVSLFPMLLKVLKPTSPNLGKILEKLDKPELLWSPYGLRSLSKSAPLFMKRNTEHDPPYWRGQVWVNINYLALASLKHYATSVGPYADRAKHLHDELRRNLVGNILSEYKRTGYLWEQYSSEDGRGSGCRPFTGWTALVVLIMAEDY